MAAPAINAPLPPWAAGEGMVILGVDPGLNATGYGVVAVEGSAYRVIDAGAICPPRRQLLPERLDDLRRGLVDVISRHRPAIMVLEMVFTHHRYPATAALMAHARGVACVTAQEHGLTVAEYPPARVKQAVTGNGNASKVQVARMVAQWLGALDPDLSLDATDALALAVAHAHMDGQKRQLPAGTVR